MRNQLAILAQIPGVMFAHKPETGSREAGRI